jgi:polysaccharide biosynthesis transport protein
MYLEPAGGGSKSDGNSNGLLEYLHLIKEHKLLLVALLILGAMGGCVFSLLQVPIYEVHTFLEFQSIGSTDALPGVPDADTGGFSPENYLQTQVRVLESRSLTKRVRDKIKAEGRPTSLPPVKGIAAWRRALLSRLRPQPRSTSLPTAEVHPKLMENSRIIEITCDSADPQFSATFANTLADEYIEYSMESLWQSANRTEDWMSRQLRHLKANLEKSEEQLQQYSQANQLVYTGAQETIEENTLKQLQEELSTARADRIAKQSLFEMAASTQVDSIPQVADNGRLSDYQRRIADLKQELAELLSLYTPSHYKVVKLQAQISDLQNTLNSERQTVRSRIKNEYEAAQRREQLLGAEYGKEMETLLQTDKKSVYYDILKHEVDTDRAIYDQLLQKTKQVGIGSAVRASNIRVLDPAEAPVQPTKPNVAQNASFGVLFGLVLGFGLLIGREFIDQSLRAPGEAPIHLQVPELGVIPSTKSLPPASERRVRSEMRDGTQIDSAFGRAAWEDTPSWVAESFRNTVASIMVSGQGGSRPKVVMLTSAGRAEGKSSVASNLGISLAEIDQKVLLIDADMRKPHLHEIFDVSNTWGLSDLLREKSGLVDCPIEALTRTTDIQGLYLLPSGPGTVSIANLLYSIRLSQLLQRVRSEFDLVIIDTPPMLFISDARVLGRLADGAILVIRASKTSRDSVRAAKQRLLNDGIPVLGTILNDWDAKSKSRYGYYYPY